MIVCPICARPPDAPRTTVRSAIHHCRCGRFVAIPVFAGDEVSYVSTFGFSVAPMIGGRVIPERVSFHARPSADRQSDSAGEEGLRYAPDGVGATFRVKPEHEASRFQDVLRAALVDAVIES